ncbi:MAG TPA: hypothetical protein VIU11_22265 [Nakamurella sp.]
MFLGEVQTTIGKKSHVFLEAPKPWRPPSVRLPWGKLSYKQHSCVVARITGPFFDTQTGIWEVTPENNEAQSNYTWTASTTSSPASREVTTLLLQNPWEVPAVMSVTVRQPHPLFRVYLDHAWVRLEPGEQQRVVLMIESLLGDERFADIVEEFEHGERMITTDVRLAMFGDDMSSCTSTLVGGATVLAMTGTGTQFEFFEAVGGLGHGRVIEAGSGHPVDGRVLVVGNTIDPDSGEPEVVREADLFDGEFRVEHGRDEEGVWEFSAFYLGRYPWTPCESEPVRF